jgi:hypothetical protein
MPAVPIIAAVSGASAAIGTATAAAIGLGTVSGITATAIGSGIIAGGMTAIQGGDVSDVLESAVIGGATSYVGGAVSNAVGGVVAEATGSQIAGGAAGGAAAALVTGGSDEDILASGLLGGIGAGIKEAKLAAADEYLNSLPGGYGDYTDIPADVSDFDLPPSSTPLPPSYEFPTASPVNIDAKLAALNVAQAVAPNAVTALLTKNAYDLATQDEQGNYRYPIVPVPGEWRSPEYDMAFTPSAPIDFGSPEMLAGTQWEAQPTVAMAQQPMDLSTLINSLNLPQQEQLPQFGMDQVVGSINDVPMSINDIIGNLGQNTMQPFDMNQNFGELDNAPASLNSIIAGIQSQYG